MNPCQASTLHAFQKKPATGWATQPGMFVDLDMALEWRQRLKVEMAAIISKRIAEQDLTQTEAAERSAPIRPRCRASCGGDCTASASSDCSASLQRLVTMSKSA